MTKRTVVLTGAAGGLGRAMAKGLAAAGHTIVMIDRDAQGLDAAAAEIRAVNDPGRITTLPGDLTDIDQVPALARAAVAAIGPVDVLINNAGLGVDHIRRDFMQRPVRFWDVEPEQAKRYFSVNGLAPFLLACALAPGMIGRRFGRIVNVTTSLDTMIRGGFAPYGGTKASLEAHSAIMAHDLQGTGVTVNVLIPGGPADTPMIPTETGLPREQLIRPAAMVPPLLFILSDEANEISGRRVIAVQWDQAIAAREAIDRASTPAAWPGAGAQTVWPGGKPPAAIKS